MASHTVRPIDLTDLSGGLRCDVPSHDIAPNQLYDVQNFDVDSPGRLLSRKGYRRISDAGIADAPVRGVYEHVERDGRKRVIAACNGRLWRLNERQRTWDEIYREPVEVASWGANLLSNGTFDANTTGWTLTNNGTNTTIARDTTNPYAGAGCLKIVTTEPTEMTANPGFETVTEDDFDKWFEIESGGGTVSDGGTGHSGSHCIMFNVGVFPAGAGATSDHDTLNILDTYRAICWAKTAVSGSPSCHFAIGLFVPPHDTSYEDIWNVDSYNNSEWFKQSGYLFTDDYPVGATEIFTYVYAHATVEHGGGIAYFDDVSLKARPRFEDSALSPAAAIIPANRRRISFKLKKGSAIHEFSGRLNVYAKYYTVGDELIDTVDLFGKDMGQILTTYKTFTVQQVAGVAPSNATKMKLYFGATNFYMKPLPGFDMEDDDGWTGGNGFYIDEVEINEVDDSSTVITPLAVDEKTNPTFVSFMGNCYIFGYDKNIKLINAKAIEFLPSFPQSAQFCIKHLNRLFIAGDPGFPSRLYYTEYTQGGMVNPDVVDELGFIDFDPDDGDMITGISPCGAGIVVFKRHGTFMLTGSNETDWFVRKVSSAIGCASHRSIASYQGSVIFLDDNNPGVFMFDGSTNFTMLSRHIDPLIARIVYRGKAVAQIKDERYYLFCDDEDAVHPYNESVYVYTLKTGAWTKYAGIYAESACKGEKDLYAGSAVDDGLVFRLFDGYEDDGEDIESYIVTGDNQFRRAGVESRVRKVTIIADSGTDDQEIEISYAADRAYLMRDAAPMSLAATGKNKWGVGLWGGFDYDAAFNVKDYGALGDGVTDDTAAIQSADTAMEA